MNSNLNIGKVLHQGNSPSVIISSAVFALILFFYVFTVGSYFHVSVSPLVNRVNYHEPFAAYIINEFVDQLVIAYGTVLWLGLSLRGKARIVSSVMFGAITAIAVLAGLQTLFDALILLSIPIIISILIFNRFTPKKILHAARLSLTYLSILGIAIGFVSIIVSFAPLFSVTEGSIPIPDFAYKIFVLLGSICPMLILFLIMGSPFKLMIKKFSTGQEKSMKPFSNGDNIRAKTKILYLVLFMLISLTIALIPHQAAINHDNQQVGSDSIDYVLVINTLAQSNNPQEFTQKLFVIPTSGDRPFASLFFYTIGRIWPDNISYPIDHIPIILGPALVLAVFFLTRELTSNDTTSLLASFLTAVSFQTLIGIYAGLYANWVALIIGFLSFVFLIRFLKVSSKRNLAIYAGLMMLLVFSHVYTWTIFALFSGIFLGIMYKMNSYRKKNIIILLIVVLSSVAVDAARSSLTGTNVGIESDAGLANTAGIGQLTSLWSNLTDTTRSYAGALFGNFIIFSLGIYWLFRSNSRELSSIFISIFLAMAILPLLFGNDVIQSRMLYDIPFQIPAAIGLTYLKRHANGIYMILPICIWLVAMSVRAVSNFHFISPG